MLTTLDIDLIRRDPTLLGLGIVLDADALAGVLRRSLPQIDLESARIAYVRYKPRTVCLVGYQLVVDGKNVDIYAKAFGDNAPVKLQKAREQPGWRGALGRGRIPLEDYQIVVSTFPNDGKVKGLPYVVESELRLHLLGKIFRDQTAFRDGTLQGLVYKPERRYVARLQTESGPRAVLKFYAQSDYRHVAQRYQEPYKEYPPLRLASKLGDSKRRAVLAFEWLPGKLLSEALKDQRFDDRAMAMVGAALAQLHTQAGTGLAHVTHAQQAKTLISEAAVLSWICPHLAQQAESAARRMSAYLIKRPPVYRLIHGDLHARQVLLDGDTAALLDLDRAVYADPMIDLGLFASHLEREVIRGNLPAARVEPMMQALVEGYTDVTHQPVGDAELQFCTAVELLRLAPRFFRYRELNWPERTEACLNRVETLLAHPGSPEASLSSSARQLR